MGLFPGHVGVLLCAGCQLCWSLWHCLGSGPDGLWLLVSAESQPEQVDMVHRSSLRCAGNVLWWHSHRNSAIFFAGVCRHLQHCGDFLRHLWLVCIPPLASTVRGRGEEQIRCSAHFALTNASAMKKANIQGTTAGHKLWLSRLSGLTKALPPPPPPTPP